MGQCARDGRCRGRTVTLRRKADRNARRRANQASVRGVFELVIRACTRRAHAGALQPVEKRPATLRSQATPQKTLELPVACRAHGTQGRPVILGEPALTVPCATLSPL